MLPERRTAHGLHHVPVDPGGGDEPAGPASPAPAKEGARQAIARALRSMQFWTMVIAYTCYALVVGIFGVHLIALLGAKGFSTGEVVLIASLVGPMQVAGRLAQFGLGDALDVRRLSRIVFAMLPIAMAILLMAPAQSLFIAFFVVFYGVGIGIQTILRGTAMPALFGREKLRRAVEPAVGAGRRRACGRAVPGIADRRRVRRLRRARMGDAGRCAGRAGRESGSQRSMGSDEMRGQSKDFSPPIESSGTGKQKSLL
jgi:hypothetical protein